MADTTTANIGLLLPDLNDTFNFGAHVENNFTTIDGLMGAVDCTSTSRPSNTYKGQIIYEHDTGRYAQNTGTKAVPAWTYTSHAALSGLASALPTSGLSNGMFYYATDTNALMVSDGGILRWKTMVVCTSSTRPTAVEAGAEIYETDTKRYLVYNGSAWEQKAFSNFVCTSSTHPSSPFQGLEIYETDTGMSAVYSGSNYQYQLQQLAPTQTISAAASVTFSSIPAVKRLHIFWRAKYSTGATDLLLQIDGNTGSSYVWSKVTGRTAAVSASDGGGATTSAKVGVLAGTTANYSSSGEIVIDGWNLSTSFASLFSVSTAWDSATSYWAEQYAALFTVVGPHTSIKLSVASSTMTGEFSIYGSM